MSLNIKNEHVHDLVRRASERTGLSQTSVVERAIEELLARLDDDIEKRRRLAGEALDRLISHFDESDRDALSTDFLYDENGLPA